MGSQISQKPNKTRVMSELVSSIKRPRHRELYRSLDLNRPIHYPTLTKLNNQSLICNDMDMVTFLISIVLCFSSSNNYFLDFYLLFVIF